EQPATVDKSSDEMRIRVALESVGPLPEVNKPVLLHGDFWPGNILWQNGRLAAVIDWEDAEFGDPLSDIAISRFDILFILGLEAMISFTDHYKSLTIIDFTNLAHWDLFAALRAAPNLGEWSAGFSEFGRGDITEQTTRERHQWFTNQA